MNCCNMKSQKQRVSKIMSETILRLCSEGLIYKTDLRIQSVIAGTIDGHDFLVIQIDEVVGCFRVLKSISSERKGNADDDVVFELDDPESKGHSAFIQATISGATIKSNSSW